jgi:predicted metal-dependent phosphoesterase TrpH
MIPGAVGAIHIHSDYSHDGRDSLERLRDFGLQRDLSFLALSDHAEDLNAGTFEEYRMRCAELSDERLRLIPGLEYRFAEHPGLHLLALGLTRYLQPETPEEFLSQAHGSAGLTVIAHPILCRYRIPREVLESIDAIEVWNAAYNTRYLPDLRAIRVLHETRRHRPEAVGIAGLDQHDCRNDRETRIVLSGAGADPLEEIQAGRFANQGRTMTFDSRVSWGRRRLAALTVIRWGYDRIERTQEWFAKASCKPCGNR